MKKSESAAFEWPEQYIHYNTYAELLRERKEAEKAGDWGRYRMLDKAIFECSVIPEVGVPGTVHYYTDSCSGYVKQLLTPKKLVFQETGIYSGTYTFSLRKNGRWVAVGENPRDGLILTLGWAHDYRCEEI